MNTIRVTTTQNIDIDYEIANVGERIAAKLIDWFLLYIFFLIALFSFTSYFSHGRNYDDRLSWPVIIVYIFLLAVAAFYDLLCEIFMNGQTVGKKLLKIRVISLDGGQATVGKYFLRWLFGFIDFSLTLYMGGLISALITEKRQRIGDVVAGTILVKTNPSTKLDHLKLKQVEDNYQPIFKEAQLLTDHDMELINEVLYDFMKTRNHLLVYKTALRTQEHLRIAIPPTMNEMDFLRTIIKDHNYYASQGNLE